MKDRLDSLKTKNKKSATLIAKQDTSFKSSTYSTPLINLLSIELTSDEINQFKEWFVKKNVYSTTDYTYIHLKHIKDPNLVVVSGDKERYVVILNKSDYWNKKQQTINDGIHDGIYKVTVDNTLVD